jgi:hypothetical protein
MITFIATCSGKEFKQIFDEAESSAKISSELTTISNLFLVQEPKQINREMAAPLINGINELFNAINKQVTQISAAGTLYKQKTTAKLDKKLIETIEENCKNSNVDISQDIVYYKSKILTLLHGVYANSVSTLCSWRLTEAKEQINKRIKQESLAKVTDEITTQANELNQEETSVLDETSQARQEQCLLQNK